MKNLNFIKINISKFKVLTHLKVRCKIICYFLKNKNILIKLIKEFDIYYDLKRVIILFQK